MPFNSSTSGPPRISTSTSTSRTASKRAWPSWTSPPPVEDNILKNEEIEDLIQEDLRYRDKQLLRLKDEVLDLEDLDDSVSLTEFTLDDFRLELLKYIEANRAALEEAAFRPLHRRAAQPGIQSHRPRRDLLLPSGEARRSPTTAKRKPPPRQSIRSSPIFLSMSSTTVMSASALPIPSKFSTFYRILCSGKAESYANSAIFSTSRPIMART